MSDQSPQKLLSVKEAVEEMKRRGFTITERALRDEIRLKRLRSTKIRNAHWIAQSDLDRYISDRETMPGRVA